MKCFKCQNDTHAYDSIDPWWKHLLCQDCIAEILKQWFETKGIKNVWELLKDR
jgi:hypothetical protein